MPRFLTGDELGNIKAFKYVPSSGAESKVTVTTLYDGSGKGKERAVQKLAITPTSGDGPLVRQANTLLAPALTLTDPRSKGSSRARRRVCFCLPNTSRGFRDVT